LEQESRGGGSVGSKSRSGSGSGSGSERERSEGVGSDSDNGIRNPCCGLNGEPPHRAESLQEQPERQVLHPEDYRFVSQTHPLWLVVGNGYIFASAFAGVLGFYEENAGKALSSVGIQVAYRSHKKLVRAVQKASERISATLVKERDEFTKLFFA
jgi:hypothetical protein